MREANDPRRAIEAILMVADDPVEPHLLAQLLELAPRTVEELCAELAASYEVEQRGFVLARVAGGYRFQSAPDLAPYLERFVLEGQSARLSAAALETLAIVAYKQPLSRAQVAAIRGVNVDGVMRTLQQRGYIDEVGRDTGPGQAVLFGTTQSFLTKLGLDSVHDLPPLGAFVPGPEVMEALEHGLRVHPEDPVGETLSDGVADVDGPVGADDEVVGTDSDQTPDASGTPQSPDVADGEHPVAGDPSTEAPPVTGVDAGAGPVDVDADADPSVDDDLDTETHEADDGEGIAGPAERPEPDDATDDVPTIAGIAGEEETIPDAGESTAVEGTGGSGPTAALESDDVVVELPTGVPGEPPPPPPPAAEPVPVPDPPTGASGARPGPGDGPPRGAPFPHDRSAAVPEAAAPLVAQDPPGPTPGSHGQDADGPDATAGVGRDDTTDTTDTGSESPAGAITVGSPVAVVDDASASDRPRSAPLGAGSPPPSVSDRHGVGHDADHG